VQQEDGQRFVAAVAGQPHAVDPVVGFAGEAPAGVEQAVEERRTAEPGGVPAFDVVLFAKERPEKRVVGRLRQVLGAQPREGERMHAGAGVRMDGHPSALRVFAGEDEQPRAGVPFAVRHPPFAAIAADEFVEQRFTRDRPLGGAENIDDPGVDRARPLARLAAFAGETLLDFILAGDELLRGVLQFLELAVVAVGQPAHQRERLVDDAGGELGGRLSGVFAGLHRSVWQMVWQMLRAACEAPARRDGTPLSE